MPKRDWNPSLNKYVRTPPLTPQQLENFNSFQKVDKSLPQFIKFYILLCESDIFFWSIKNQTFQCENNYFWDEDKYK